MLYTNTIRYRVYCKEAGKYIETSGATDRGSKLIREIGPTESSHVVELGTGMEDGGGLEIFVGDVITIDHEEFFEVVYDADEGSYRASGEGVSTSFYDIPPYAYYIVGNIHDNKEMLGD